MQVGVGCCLVAQSCLTLCDPMNRSTPGIPVHHHSQSSPKPMSIESVMPSNHLILCRPLLHLPSIFSSIRVASGSFPMSHIRWPKYWSFSLNISASSEHSGLISCRMEYSLIAKKKKIKKESGYSGGQCCREKS